VLLAFDVGLREGLGAAVVVGLVAAVLRRRADRRAQRALRLAVVTAVVPSAAVGGVLQLAGRHLRPATQEGFGTVVGALAVVVVTVLVVRVLAARTRSAPARIAPVEPPARVAPAEPPARTAAWRPLGRGGDLALIGLAVLAVFRAAVGTVPLLAALSREPGSWQAGVAVLVGVAVAAVVGQVVGRVVGWALSRAGVRVGRTQTTRSAPAVLVVAVLVLVAAGLLVDLLGAADEVGWFRGCQRPLLDLRGLVGTGTPVAAVVGGLLGIPARPSVSQVVGWVAYVTAAAALVVRTRRRHRRRHEVVAAADGPGSVDPARAPQR